MIYVVKPKICPKCGGPMTAVYGVNQEPYDMCHDCGEVG